MYTVTRSFYVGNTLHEFGSDFTSDNQEQINELLADGNIAAKAEGGSESTTPLAETVAQPPVTQPEAPQTSPVEQVTPPVESAPTPPPQPSEGVALTPEQLQEDFAKTSSEPSNGVQLQ